MERKLEEVQRAFNLKDLPPQKRTAALNKLLKGGGGGGNKGAKREL